MHYTDYDTRLAAYAVIVDEGRILLAWWNGEGRAEPKFTLPGGGVDFEETVEEAAVREVLEETGYHVELGRLLCVSSYTIPREQRANPLAERPLKAMRIVFEGSVVGGRLGTTEVDGSTDRAEWVALADLPTIAHTDVIDVAVAALDAGFSPATSRPVSSPAPPAAGSPG